jgi:hypothetical protein
MASLKDEFLDGMEERRDRKLAESLGLSYEELQELDWHLEENISSDGDIYSLMVKFSDSSPKHILQKIKGLDETNTVHLPPFALDEPEPEPDQEEE